MSEEKKSISELCAEAARVSIDRGDPPDMVAQWIANVLAARDASL